MHCDTPFMSYINSCMFRHRGAIHSHCNKGVQANMPVEVLLLLIGMNGIVKLLKYTKLITIHYNYNTSYHNIVIYSKVLRISGF